MTQIIPHLSFDGNAKEAFDFYKGVFGGDLIVMNWSENPDCDQMAEADKQKVMHASLTIPGGVLMGNDYVDFMGNPFAKGNNFSVTLVPDSREESDRLFGGLSDGGMPFMPMQDVFWGDYFGALSDKFGISWMINFDPRKES